jgi:hypothetical protein
MTAQRSFKRLVRARMAKTGESYTAARQQLLAASARGPAADRAGVPWLACSDERIRARTGHGWEHWFALLDSWGAESLDHTQLTKQLAEHLGEPPLGWNPQAIVTSFERSRGKRGVGERVGRDGYVASASKTIGVPAEELFAAFVDPSVRSGWLGLALAERTVNASKATARFDVADGTSRVVVSVRAKGAERSTVAVEQSRLGGSEARDAQRAFWRGALRRLAATLEVDR